MITTELKQRTMFRDELLHSLNQQKKNKNTEQYEELHLLHKKVMYPTLHFIEHHEALHTLYKLIGTKYEH